MSLTFLSIRLEILKLKNIFLCPYILYTLILFYFFSKNENLQKHTKKENNQRAKLNKQIQIQLHLKNQNSSSILFFLN